MLVQKGNLQYRIHEEDKQSYIKKGYDVIDQKGAVLERGQRLSYTAKEFEKLLEENNYLKSKNAELTKKLDTLTQEAKVAKNKSETSKMK